jgi:hypothetical protein
MLFVQTLVKSIHPTGNINSSLFVLWMTTILTILFGRTGWKYHRLEGAILILIAVARIALDLLNT